MLTTLDAKPQEWMENVPDLLHTVTACSFDDPNRIEYWIDTLVPKNKNGEPLKWSGGRRKDGTRLQFMQNCIQSADSMDFLINCVSSVEGRMSWIAWAFYMDNRSLIDQELDEKGRNCLAFKGLGPNGKYVLPVLRAGYLIWYNRVVRYLCEVHGINGKFLTDNFANDKGGTGPDSAQGVGFVNFLLKDCINHPRLDVPIKDRFRKLDLISDNFCGWVNEARSQPEGNVYMTLLDDFRRAYTDFDEIMFDTNLTIRDENGKDITKEVEQAIMNDSTVA